MRIHCLQHVVFEGPAGFESWAKDRGHTFKVTRFFEGEPLPPIDEVDLLIVMGGPMNIDEETAHPWLKEEKAFLEMAIASRTKTVGVCLGAQLIASVLGARVYKNPEPEIGWFPIRWTSGIREFSFFHDTPESFVPFHWHFDTFEMPERSRPIAESAACKNQGFVFDDHVVGLQFHPEMSVKSVRGMLEHCSADLSERSFIQTKEAMLSNEQAFSESMKFLYAFLDKFVAQARRERN